MADGTDTPGQMGTLWRGEKTTKHGLTRPVAEDNPPLANPVIHHRAALRRLSVNVSEVQSQTKIRIFQEPERSRRYQSPVTRRSETAMRTAVSLKSCTDSMID
ncbi:uncharacterized protein PV07_10170 [Cladophialophora immunda]|uniref:Uncharacterized protein n=1 Tax=Cladophialophora immunda TaxID=569365 RepID=A0A0D2BZF0_9EURO|nr:uncharacterized protein PV07_10170 [Cladophialophora immunda]KIW24458.1 hypothetical protein PV07_10170 [Cladophialophora immunda]